MGPEFTDRKKVGEAEAVRVTARYAGVRAVDVCSVELSGGSHEGKRAAVGASGDAGTEVPQVSSVFPFLGIRPSVRRTSVPVGGAMRSTSFAALACRPSWGWYCWHMPDEYRAA